MIRLASAWVVLGFVISGAAFAADADLYPDSIGPFAGDWEGLWSRGEDKHPWIGAQVIARGNGEYEIVLTRKLYARAPQFRTVSAREKGDSLVFDDGDYYGAITGDVFSGGRRGGKPGEFQLGRYTREPETLGTPPPENAIVLFDGSGTDEWELGSKGGTWEMLPGGVMQADPDAGDIVTKRTFTDVQLHIEFRLPFMPNDLGQKRANSGVFLQRFFEVQILDSYGLSGVWNECGAIYQISGPRVNMCLPPLQWQSYDITFRAARYAEDGTITEYPRMTVIHNGVPVQTEIEMTRGTSGDFKKKPVEPPSEPDVIRLQTHGNRVQFRNIWVVDLAE